MAPFSPTSEFGGDLGRSRHARSVNYTRSYANHVRNISSNLGTISLIVPDNEITSRLMHAHAVESAHTAPTGMPHDRTATGRNHSLSTHAKPPHGAATRPSYRCPPHLRVLSARSRTCNSTPRAMPTAPMLVECAGVITANGDCRDPGHRPHRAAATTRRRNSHAGTCDHQSGIR